VNKNFFNLVESTDQVLDCVNTGKDEANLSSKSKCWEEK